MRVRFGLASAVILGWGFLTASVGHGQQPFPSVLDAVPPTAPKIPEVSPLAAPLPGPPVALPTGTFLPETGYLEVNPNGRTSLCDHDNNISQRLWLTGAYLYGVSSDLGAVDRKTTSGARLSAGAWFDDYRTLGVDLSFLTMNDGFNAFVIAPAGASFVDSPVALATGDINLRAHILTHGRYRLDGLAGYRGLYLGEQYNSFGAVAVASKSTNTVHAFQVGGVGDYHFGPYFSEVAVKLAVGQNTQRTTLNALTTRATKAAFIPEINFRVGYTMGSGTRFFVGYNLLYLNTAARPNNFGPTSFLLNAVQGGVEITY